MGVKVNVALRSPTHINGVNVHTDILISILIEGLMNGYQIDKYLCVFVIIIIIKDVNVEGRQSVSHKAHNDTLNKI